MHNFKLTWLLLSTLRYQLVLEQERRVSTLGALFFSFIILFFATFLVTTSNPFLRVPFPSFNSLAELNPVLQDPVLAIHPPCIYAGYVASAICFSLSLAKIKSYSSSSSFSGYKLLNFSFKRSKTSRSFLGLQLTQLLHLQPYREKNSRLGESSSSNEKLRLYLKNKKDCFLLKKSQIKLKKKPSIKAVIASMDLLKKENNKNRLPRNRWLLQPMKTTFNETKKKLTLLGFFLEHQAPSGNILNLIQVWMLASWSFLTFGILLGSWWAYHELGWGGWWFWDPVENASLMPWLLATACIHMGKGKSTIHKGNLALILSTFVLSILGTFFVRSGLLASVHSFATDSTRGFYLFLFLLSISIFSVVKIVQIQGNDNSSKKLRTVLEQILSLQNFFFCVICFVVFCGTSAPLFFLWFWNRDLSIGAPFYNGTLVPLFTSLFFLLAYTHYGQLKFFSKKNQHNNNSFFTYYDKKNSRQRALTKDFNNTKISRQNILNVFDSKKQSDWVHLSTPSAFVRLSSVKNFATVKFPTKASLFYTKFFNLNLKPIQISSNTFSISILTCIILCFFFHFLCLKAIGLSILESIYGTLCILLISIFLLGKRKLVSLLNTKIQSKNQPSRLVAFFKVSTRNGSLAMITAHVGIIIFITGIILSNTFKSQFTQLMHNGSLIRLGSEYCCLRSIDHGYAPTYHSICGNLLVTKPTELLSSRKILPAASQSLSMFPEKRFFYSNQELTTTKVAIHTNIFTDFYGLIGTGSLETGWYTTIMKLPFIFCIWLGFLLGTVGGALALKKRLQKSKLKWV